jgi:hypothetical protein
MTREGRDPGVVGAIILDVREDDRQILVRDRLGAADVAVDDGDRGTPVSLA